MNTAFDLKPGVTLDAFRARWEAFAADLMERDLIQGVGPIAERRADTPLDTDDERGHGYFVAMRFRDRAQSEAAWAQIAPDHPPTGALHRAVFALVANPVFTCWEDV